MENNNKQNYGQESPNFQEELNMVNKGFPAYGENDDSNSDNSLKDGKNKKNTEQEGFTDDSSFGHDPVTPDPNPDETDTDTDPDYEEDDSDLDKDKDIKEEEEEENPDDEDYPEEDENPDEKKEFYLKTNGKTFTVFF